MKLVIYLVLFSLALSSCNDEVAPNTPVPAEGTIDFKISRTWMNPPDAYTVEVGLHIVKDFYAKRPAEPLFDTVFTMTLKDLPGSPESIRVQKHVSLADRNQEQIIASYAFNVYKDGVIQYGAARNGYWSLKTGRLDFDIFIY
jgi:hypothetical protein